MSTPETVGSAPKNASAGSALGGYIKVLFEELLDGLPLGSLVGHLAILAVANDCAKRTKVDAGCVVRLMVYNLAYVEQIGRRIVAC
jgi:hypothetical protein